MNRYPLWKYIVIAVALLFGAVYTAPNFFGETPAVQVSSQRPTVKVDAAMLARVEAALNSAGVPYEAAYLDVVGLNVTARVRLADTDTQIRARDAIETALNPDPGDPTYVVALNLLSRSPRWLAAAGALPMYLGLDLRGGVHFLMQVNTGEAVTRRLDALVGDLRTQLRERDVRHAGIVRSGDRIEIRGREGSGPPLDAWTGKASYRLPLDGGVEGVRKALGAKVRAQVKRPLREGFSSRIAGPGECGRFYALLARKWHELGSPILPRTFF